MHRDIDATVRHGFAPSVARADPASAVEPYRARHDMRPALSGERRAGAVALDALARMGGLDARRGAFLADVLPHARRAGARLGVSPDVIVAHAALESGWGQRPLRHADGATSHNVFGIKATGGWRGAVVDSATTEYVNGAAIQTVERFRAYRDYAGAFDDYAALLANNPRYAGALNRGDDADAFARALVRGGYATDPHYAGKLAAVVRDIREGRR
ncbi:flagellar assembly peptidoglycan hydrolase FlgJ [Burkholderia ubonensis]|uniref:flagellar assembly peptidoglycan hydrolase FlgJ n=1 Tax=Burkholderia ubonensis TaxID=101571 RepID=UPI001E59C763|nr:flagellar assembly peptidoglycan hydrolase FlgJ [Burkholderia ubonensis]